MSLEQFLEGEASIGEHESAGSFTLDLSKAADKLAQFALPSHAHYLLKFVQVAHHLCADEIKIRIERFRTVVRFKAPMGGSITDSQAIYQAFCDPLVVTDPTMIDLVSGLIGTITDQNLETLWSYSQGHSGRRVFINAERRFSIEDFTLSQPKEEGEHPFSFTLSVLHPRTWKFWKGARRRAAAARVLEENCRYSGVRILVDNRELSIDDSSALIEHWRERRSFTLDDTYYSHIYHAAHNVLYRMASSKGQRFCIRRPSLSAYVVREENKNLWASGTRVNNTLVPDGTSSSGWVLQFVQDNKNVSMRYAPKRVPCNACLAVRFEGKGSASPLRLKLIRSGITVLEMNMLEDDSDFIEFRGCSLIICDNALETDLTGLQVIQNQAFVELVRSHLPLVVQALRYYEEATPLMPCLGR